MSKQDGKLRRRWQCLLIIALILSASPLSSAQEGGRGGTTAATAAPTIEDIITASVPQPAGSAFYFDRTTNNLIVTNTPTNLAILEEIISSLDIIPVQVKIDVQFIDINEEAIRSIRADWSKLSGPGLTPGYSRWNLDLLNPELTGETSSIFGSTRTSGYPNEGLRVFFERLKDYQVDLLFRAIERSGKSNILATPQVTALNNQEASIEITTIKLYKTYEEEAEISEEDYSVYQGLDGTILDRAIIPTGFEEREYGVTFVVTPHVSADQKTITLDLHPQVVEELPDPSPYGHILFAHRDLRTSVVVADGETVVMGGLIRGRKVSKHTKTPILGDIPIVSRLFRSEVSTEERRCLLIFATVHLLNPRGERIR